MKQFHIEHQKTYGYSYEGEDTVEIVAVAATGVGLLPRPAIINAESAFEAWESANLGNSDVYFAEKGTHGGGWVSTPVYNRSDLPLGVPTEGPAIVIQDDSTFVLEPGWKMQVDPTGQIIATRTSTTQQPA
jgi:N-methylhydantoinase A